MIKGNWSALWWPAVSRSFVSLRRGTLILFVLLMMLMWCLGRLGLVSCWSGLPLWGALLR